MIKLNSKKIEFGKFPNNEHYLPIEQLEILNNTNTVELIYNDDSDIVKLSILKWHLDAMGASAELHIHYMPHSRMDRVNSTYAVSLYPICKIINSLNFSKVVVREPHSIETTNNLKNAEVDNWCLDRINFILSTGFDSICFPDHGAMTRYKLNDGRIVSWGKKVRDFSTGQIKDLTLVGECGKSVLVVDDICSKGGTFVRIAKLLKEKGVNRIGLLVSYVENTIFQGEIFNYIDIVYTNSDFELEIKHPRIKQIN